MQVKYLLKNSDYYYYYDHLTKRKNIPTPKNKIQQKRIIIKQIQTQYINKYKTKITLPKEPWK
jgi:PhoPQ-activated pathogenicity-related protein